MKHKESTTLGLNYINKAHIICFLHVHAVLGRYADSDDDDDDDDDGGDDDDDDGDDY